MTTWLAQFKPRALVVQNKLNPAEDFVVPGGGGCIATYHFITKYYLPLACNVFYSFVLVQFHFLTVLLADQYIVSLLFTIYLADLTYLIHAAYVDLLHKPTLFCQKYILYNEPLPAGQHSVGHGRSM